MSTDQQPPTDPDEPPRPYTLRLTTTQAVMLHHLIEVLRHAGPIHRSARPHVEELWRMVLAFGLRGPDLLSITGPGLTPADRLAHDALVEQIYLDQFGPEPLELDLTDAPDALL